MLGEGAKLTTTLGEVVSVVAGSLWRPGRRSPLKVFVSFWPWGAGGGGGLIDDLRIES